MRKYPVLFMIAILVLAALACNVGPFGGDDEASQEETTQEQAATNTPEPTATPEPSPTSEPTPTPEPSPTPEIKSADDLMESVSMAMDGVESFHMSMDMQLELGGEGMAMEIPIQFEGDFLQPDSSAGTISFSFFGIAVEMEFVTVDGVTYMTNPETGAWEPSSEDAMFGLGELGLGGGFTSPDALLETDTTAFENLTVVGEETLDGVPVIHLQGTMPGEEFQSTEDFAVDIWVGAEDHYLYQVVIEGKAAMEATDNPLLGSEGGELSMLITLVVSNHNEPVTIEVPDVVISDVVVDDDVTFSFAEPVQSVAFFPDGSFLVSGGNDGTVRFWDPTIPSAAMFELPAHDDWIRSIAVSPDGTMMATASDDTTVQVWSSDTFGTIATLDGHEDWVRAVAFSPDGSLLASGSDDATVRIWNASDFDADPVVLDTPGFVFSVAFSADGSKLAAGGSDGTVFLIDLADLSAEPILLEGHEDWIRSVAFSPAGDYLASGSDDATVKLWDLANLDAEPMTLVGHSDWVRSVAFSADGSFLASASDDATILVWDVANPTDDPFVLEGHDGWVNAVAFNPTDDSIASGSEDGTVRLWPSDTPGEFVIFGE